MLEDDSEPRFLWREEARFKHLSAEDDLEQAGIASFGRAVATAVLQGASPEAHELAGVQALEVREQVLAHGSPYVGLQDLLAIGWGIGIPIVQLRVFPWPRKRMAAMTLRVGDRSVILLAKEAVYPAWIAFYVAHELAHIALGHLDRDEAVVDLDREQLEGGDEEEQAADRWALELLTGRERPVVDSVDETRSAAALAKVALGVADELRIEPGTLALLFGHTTKEWAVANGALKGIYSRAAPVWRVINALARNELVLAEASADAADFLRGVLGFDDLD